MERTAQFILLELYPLSRIGSEYFGHSYSNEQVYVMRKKLAPEPVMLMFGLAENIQDYEQSEHLLYCWLTKFNLVQILYMGQLVKMAVICLHGW